MCSGNCGCNPLMIKLMPIISKEEKYEAKLNNKIGYGETIEEAVVDLQKQFDLSNKEMAFYNKIYAKI